MSRFDRYMLSQLLVLFGFFALVLVLVYWVNRAVVLFDQLIVNGQSAGVFLEFTFLSLPNVIRLVLPMSVFAAAVYVTNRLSSESELTVMQATGFSPWRLARPVFVFGLLVALMMSMLMHVLVPRSTAQLNFRQNQITENITARLLTEGTFLHPTNGVTFYIREITPEGILRNVFLSDRRKAGEVSTYTAAEAYLLNSESGARLVMVDGLSQIHVDDGDRLFTTNFSDFTYDISRLISDRSQRRRALAHIGTPELLFKTDAVAKELNLSRGWLMEEVHGRFNRPLMVLSAALVGFATLLLGGFSRFGVWRQVIVAFVLLITLEIIRSATIDPVRSDGQLWPLIYLPSLLGFTLSFGLLWYAAHPLRSWRRAAA
ncbi:MAG: LPS export ABC transporter permease LptF [Rhodobacteraceae bacterium]|nr:LPS export ABC transporter permease LptF [Paracoccaceae bacterium]